MTANEPEKSLEEQVAELDREAIRNLPTYEPPASYKQSHGKPYDPDAGKKVKDADK